jgi:hypothetical protein
MKHTLTALFTLLASAVASPAASYYTVRLDDPKAVYLRRGAGDDSDAIQQAIDKVQETTGEGVVFVPEGRYRLTKTVYVWPAIRLIGYGTGRPVFVLAENTPGFQDPGNENYLVFFTGGRGRHRNKNAAAALAYYSRQGWARRQPRRPARGRRCRNFLFRNEQYRY